MGHRRNLATVRISARSLGIRFFDFRSTLRSRRKDARLWGEREEEEDEEEEEEEEDAEP